MTEAQWLACDDPTPMLAFLRGKSSDRKLRLFAVAGSRMLQPYWSGTWPVREAVDAAEQLSDGLIPIDRLTRLHRPDDEFLGEVARNDVDPWAGLRSIPVSCLGLILVQAVSSPDAYSAARGVSLDDLPVCVRDWDQKRERLSLCCLLRDIFHGLFRTLAPLPLPVLAGNDGVVRRLAEGIYDERAFDRLPILADALEDAGGTDAAILEHCRGPGPHVRGCWVVDLILGQS
jgi:hypothetical protein